MEGGSERRDSRLHTCIQHPRKPSVSVCVSIHMGLEFRGNAVFCVFFLAGLQTTEGFHHRPGPNEVHKPRLLEDDLQQEMQCDCHAL